jgi:predicted NBD/HSP70 family sugar kinase
MAFLVFDVGGTNMRMAYSVDGKTFEKHEKIKTPKTPKEAVKVLKDFSSDLPVSHIGGGMRGVLMEDKSGIENDDQLEKWSGISMVDLLSDAFGKKVSIHLENDAALAGLAESVRGAGVGCDIVVYHTISTGVGGAKIEHGQIDHASVGFEPGKQILDIDRTILGPEISPTLENLVSGTAVASRMGMQPYEIDQDDVLWEELAGYLGQGLRNSVLYWSPEIIVLGGSMITGDPKILIDDIRKATVETLGDIVPCPFITVATLGDDAVLYGALHFAQQDFSQN